MKENNTNDRRNFLKTAGAVIVAASIPSIVAGQKSEKAETNNQPQSVYLHGCAWDGNQPGVFGKACFTFDIRAEVGGTGLGTIRDDVYPEVNSQFRINSVTRRGKQYMLEGEIIASRSPDLIGSQVTIAAESLGNAKGIVSITMESEGQNRSAEQNQSGAKIRLITVTSIIAILIG